MPIIMIMEGTPPLTGRALPNLINAVKMFKVKIKTASILAFAEINKLTLILILTF